MNYDKYYKLCRDQYKDTKPAIESFYSDPVRTIPGEVFSDKVMDTLKSISVLIKEQFDSGLYTDPIMPKHGDIWQYRKEIEIICEVLVPYLEKERYGCHLYVDKVYIYRTKKIKNRTSSYQWHYDNNPNEIVKTIIYLNNVDENNSPFEYFVDNQEKGVLGKCTRMGTDCWYAAPAGSRADNIVAESLIKGTHKSIRLLGPLGTACSFNNNSIHRANPVEKGYRDVINIRVKPTLISPPTYISPLWTTSFEKSGVVNQDPELSWCGAQDGR